MSIHILPESTVRSLGSSQVLTDPVSLVKELIENSLDAGATQITIEATSDLITSITVKDNGHGIHPDDRPFACKRHCTSKIRTFTDIATAHTLGFRGEALSAACELSDSLIFTTRVEGEATAAQCETNRDGTIKSTRSIGAPVGTSIKVSGFLGKVPVRKENAKRNAVKNMQKLRVLVGTYYIARSRTRFALRIVKGKGKDAVADGGDLVYPPSKTVVEAARKVMGRDVADAGVWFSNVERKTAAEFAVEAYMLKPDGGDKAGAKGQYVYVDGRPMAGERGILKKILGLYKSTLKNAWGVEKLQEPFLYLNLRCPEQSYDANVEPAKDDVMFSHEMDVVDAVEEALKEVYGELGEKSKRKEKPSGGGAQVGGFDILLARKTPPAERGPPKQGVAEPAETDNTARDEDAPQVHASSYELLAPYPSEPEALDSLVTPQSPEPVMSQHFGHARSRAADPPASEGMGPPEDNADEPGILIRTRHAEEGLNSDSVKEHDAVETELHTKPPGRMHTRDWGKNTSFEIEEDDIPGADEDLEGLIALDEETIEAEREQVRKDKSLSNPWTAAKEAASYRSPTSTRQKKTSSKPPNPSNIPFKLQRPHRAAAVSAVSPTSERTPRSRNRLYEDPYRPPSPSSSPARAWEPAPKRQRLEDTTDNGPIDAFLIRTPRSAARPNPAPPAAADPDRNDETIDEFGFTLAQRMERQTARHRMGMGPETFEEETEFLIHDRERQNKPQPPRGKNGKYISARQLLLQGDAEETPGSPEVTVRDNRRHQKVPSDDPLDVLPPPKRKNPSKNRYKSVTAALLSPRPTSLHVPERRDTKRLRTRSLLPLEAVPEPQYQTFNVIRPVSLAGETLQKLAARNRIAGSAYRYTSPEDPSFEPLPAEELGKLLLAWTAQRGVDIDGIMGWTEEITSEGWRCLSAGYGSSSTLANFVYH